VIGGRHNDPQTPHERARSLASDRLDAPLTASDAIWLDEHLAGCADCRAIAAAYAEDRELLRSLPVPEPPRDLWARTSVALERERAARPEPELAPPTPRVRWEALVGIAAVLIVGVLVGRSLLPSGGSPGVGLGSPVPTVAGSAAAGATPIAVAPAPVSWVERGADGSYTVNLASVNAVCQDESACAPLNAGAQAIASLHSRPGSVVLAPKAPQAAVVESSASTTGGSIIVVPITRPTPAPSPVPTATATPAGSAAGSSSSPSPAASASPSGTPSASKSPAAPVSPSPTPSATTEPTASPEPSASAEPSPTPTASPVATGTPAPTAAAALAIIENVIVVGGDAAYSPDGSWLAFSARPADGSAGPDVYVWQVGDARARAITDDHQTVFSDWDDQQIVASRPAVTTDKAASASSDGTSPVSVVLDPATGTQIGPDLHDIWLPVVDGSGRWVVYWSGQLVFDATTRTWLPGDGRLAIDRWSATDGSTPAATPDPQPLDAGTGSDHVQDWEVRWDPTGHYLGVWIGDPLTPGIGRLSVLPIDRSTGRVDTSHDAILRDTPALAGFAIGDGRIAWATPPGENGDGSRLSVLAWKGPDAGRMHSEPAPAQEDIVVVR